MQIPPQVVLKGVDGTPYVDMLIARGIAKLEQVCYYIVSLRIAVEPVQRRRRTGNTYRMRIFIGLPDRRDIKVERVSSLSKRAREGTAPLQAEALCRLVSQHPGFRATIGP